MKMLRIWCGVILGAIIFVVIMYNVLHVASFSIPWLRPFVGE
jgi:hypothetical protein